MIFIDNYDSSHWNKSLFSGCIILTLFATLWLMFAEDPSLKEKVWWLLFKPFHGIFANKSLSVIKSKIM